MMPTNWSFAAKKRGISRLSEVNLRPCFLVLRALNCVKFSVVKFALKFNFCVGGVWGKFSFLNLTGRIFTANLSGNFQSSVKLGVKFDELRGHVAA